MVSLINFKTVDEDLSESRACGGDSLLRRVASPSVDKLQCENAAGDEAQAAKRSQIQNEPQDDTSSCGRFRPEDGGPNNHEEAGRALDYCCTGCDYYCYDCGNNNNNNNNNLSNRYAGQQVVASGVGDGSAGQGHAPGSAKATSAVSVAANFTVTWRKLKFCIEPKWHERLASGPASLAALAGRTKSASANAKIATTTTSAPGAGKLQPASVQQPQQTAATSRVVLDQLDGSFKSGELTAILGPSGAGKTTLLDCLTGHRKSGLTGSVRLSLSSTRNDGGCICNECNKCIKQGYIHDHPTRHSDSLLGAHKQRNLVLTQANCCSFVSKQLDNGPPNGITNKPHVGVISKVTPVELTAEAINGDNLKVSIIPQNDHLIGHLTVYETLNYASKMKNCSESQFDHKLNVRRVAQQLGLMSCLGTRINKLSGGQYKRVSIAQELLSSPDVLILDEPTSGLDAMTCFQTVQVLKKLTDDCAASGQKSIAVILTIHQPNSDVFQQFNHVYVVAQGGKCIYEGPPANIESVINRVGIRLPNSYYNPATMIVEIAAGKFGQGAISKLNTIQRKQYSESAPIVDEQNSTGDSAVDCPSSTYEDDDVDDDDHDDDDDDGDDGINNDKMARLDPSVVIKAGKVNAGFTMENDNNNNNNNNKFDSYCMPLGPLGGATLACKCDQACCTAGSGQHANLATTMAQADKQQDRRKKRRRNRRRASGLPAMSRDTSRHDAFNGKRTAPETLSAVRILMSATGGGGGGGDGDSGDCLALETGHNNGGRSEKRLKLNSLKADQKFPFWRHTYLHFHRSWLSIVRDPMLCSMQLALHIIVPVMVSLVYGTYVGKPNACPRAGPIDLMAYAAEPTDTALQLQEDLRTTLENIGYIFFKLYGIIFAAMTVTVLTFPLDMHVLVKEFRNGWYGLASYFLGRTLADIPFQLTLPLLAMSLSYYATGQPTSHYQWRFFSITAILILSSLIAQSQGLLFGAILMDKMKAAVFVAPAATTPIILFAGFLVRTQSIPGYLRPLSNLSYLRYAIEACLISRYGFNQCECDPAMFNQTVRELPPIARSMLDYYLSSYTTTPEPALNGTSLDGGGGGGGAADSMVSTEAANHKPDLFTKLIDSLSRANSFGRNITSCEQVVPYPMIDYDLKDEQLYSCFAILLAMLIFTRLLTFFIVCHKVKRKV